MCPQPAEVSEFLATSGVDPAGRLELQEFSRPAESDGRIARWRRRFLGGRVFQEARRRLRRWERERAATIDLVFFSCIYDREFTDFPMRRLAWPYRWSGLYLQLTAITDRLAKTRPEEFHWLLSQDRMAALAVLDERNADVLSRLTGRPVVLFPDFTDASIEGPGEQGVAAELLRFAAGAPVVGAMGHLYPNKGIVTLAKLALERRHPEWRFAFVGDLPWEAFEPYDAELLRETATLPNVFMHPHRVASESEFNRVIAACDVVFAAYIDFPHSSNIVTKAALLKKPLVVSDNGVMAERVRGFQLGVVVPQGDVSATEDAIGVLLASPVLGATRSDFEQRFGASALTAAFSRLFEVTGA